MKIKKKKLNRFILAFILMVFLPVLLTLLIVTKTIFDLQDFEFAKTKDFLSLKANEIAASVHSEAYLKPYFDSFAQQFFALEIKDAESLAKIAEQINSRAGAQIFAAAFNKDGELIKSHIYPKEHDVTLQYLWHYIANFKNRESYHRIKPQLQKVFGRDFHPRKLNGSETRMVSFTSSSKPGLIYYSRRPGKDKGRWHGVLLYVVDLPDREVILQKLVNHFSASQTHFAIKLVEQNKGFIGKNTDGQRIERAINYNYAAKQSFIVKENWVWHKMSVADFAVVIGKKLASNYFFRLRLLAWLLAIILTIVGFMLSAKYFLAKKQLWLSIRFKLIIVFIFAVYLPLLGLFFLSFRGLHDRQMVLENQARKGMLDVLYKLDSDFTKKEEEMLATFNRLYEDRSWQKNFSDNWFRNDKMIKVAAGVPLEGENFFNWLEIRDSKLDQIFSTARGASNERIKALNRVMAQISLEKFVPQLLAPHKKKIRQSDFIIRNVIENPALGFNHFFEVPGQLVQMEFEGAFLYWYWNYYKNPVGEVVYLGGNTRIQFNISDYLQKALQQRYSIDNQALILTSFSPNEQKWIPMSYADKPELANLNRLTALQNRITSAKIKLDGRLYMAICFPGIKMREVFVTCLYPCREIDFKIETLRKHIYFGMLLILIVAVLTGLLLTHAFLKPLGELNQGLLALHDRQTEFRVNITNKDEFGDLGETFNQMMVEVKEMLLAGAVQQCLIPSQPPDIPGYELIVYNQMATDVGGDYADAFILPDNKFLLVLGDVTGHGISSSILTAMVKALVFRFSKKPHSLSLMLKQLSEMIFDLLKHRKLMTFCALLVDRDTGEFKLANAGHPYPVFCNVRGETRTIEHSSLPLGVSRKRSVYEEKAGQLASGDFFLVYTDGIAEAVNKQGEMFGFKRVEELVSKNAPGNALELKEVLLNEFWQHYDQKNLDDDLTFVILKRL